MGQNQQLIEKLLASAVTSVCVQHVCYQQEVRVEGTLTITTDNQHSFTVTVRDTLQAGGDQHTQIIPKTEANVPAEVIDQTYEDQTASTATPSEDVCKIQGVSGYPDSLTLCDHESKSNRKDDQSGADKCGLLFDLQAARSDSTNVILTKNYKYPDAENETLDCKENIDYVTEDKIGVADEQYGIDTSGSQWNKIHIDLPAAHSNSGNTQGYTFDEDSNSEMDAIDSEADIDNVAEVKIEESCMKNVEGNDITSDEGPCSVNSELDMNRKTDICDHAIMATKEKLREMLKRKREAGDAPVHLPVPSFKLTSEPERNIRRQLEAYTFTSNIFDKVATHLGPKLTYIKRNCNDKIYMDIFRKQSDISEEYGGPLPGARIVISETGVAFFQPEGGDKEFVEGNVLSDISLLIPFLGKLGVGWNWCSGIPYESYRDYSSSLSVTPEHIVEENYPSHVVRSNICNRWFHSKRQKTINTISLTVMCHSCTKSFRQVRQTNKRSDNTSEEKKKLRLSASSTCNFRFLSPESQKIRKNNIKKNSSNRKETEKNKNTVTT